MRRLQVSIVTFNNARTIARCLQSVLDELHGTGTGGPAIDAIDIVDNASTDETCTIVREGFPTVRVQVAELNLGFGTAHNRILAATEAERVLFLNPDAALTPGALASLDATLSAQEDLALVGPRLERPQGDPEVSFGPFPGVVADARQRQRVRSVARGEQPAIERLEADLTEAFRPDWISGACMLGRTDVLQEVGCFDERFFLYLEDVDLCKRLQMAGYGVAVDPRARVLHEGGGSQEDREATTQAFRASRLTYEEIHGTRLGAFLYRSFRS